MLLIAAVLSMMSVGCSSERRQHHVSGSVKYGEQVVPAGAVFFDPDVAKGNDGTQGYAKIKDGHFDTSTTGRGITGGAYIMRVRGYVPANGDTPPKMLFEEYRKNIELPMANSEQDISVPTSAKPKSDVSWEPT